VAKLQIKRAIRGAAKRSLQSLIDVLSDPAGVLDESGKLLIGVEEGSQRHPIVVDGVEVGTVIGGGGSAALAGIVQQLYERERDKRSLATETLSRYKELTLLYEMSEKLSKVLDPAEVATMVVGEAKRFLNAASATILVRDPNREVLEVIASVGPEFVDVDVLPLESGLTGRVFASGRAELVDDVEDTDAYVRLDSPTRSLICAPLRSGERVFGILRISDTTTGAWDSSALKLVTSLAGSAAAAIRNAMLHRDRLRQQALRGRLERWVSPWLAEAALAGRDRVDQAVVLFCDLGAIPERLSEDLPPHAVLELLDQVMTCALDELLQHDATVSTPHGEMILGLFVHEDGFDASAQSAAVAARGLASRLQNTSAGDAISVPGIGMATITVDPSDRERFRAGVNAAAALQAASGSGVYVDAPIEAAVREIVNVAAIGEMDLPTGPSQVYEVRA